MRIGEIVGFVWRSLLLGHGLFRLGLEGWFLRRGREVVRQGLDG